jgi:hypothetical protein
MELSMESYLNKLGRDYHREGAPPRYNLIDLKVLKLKLRAKNNIAPAALTERYQLRVDVSFAVGYLARAMSNPTELHYQHALQVVDYLFTTKDLVMGYQAPASRSSVDIDVYSKVLRGTGKGRFTSVLGDVSSSAIPQFPS